MAKTFMGAQMILYTETSLHTLVFQIGKNGNVYMYFDHNEFEIKGGKIAMASGCLNIKISIQHSGRRKVYFQIKTNYPATLIIERKSK